MTQYSIAQVQEKAVEITQQGKQVAVLLSMDEYQRLVGGKQSGLDVALAKFRQELLEEGLDIDPDEVFKDVRDKSPGRDVSL